MRLAVIVLAHNQAEITRECLSALGRALQGIDHEVCCVDNASSEDLRPLADEAHAFERFVLRRNAKNDTFSVANNAAAADSSGDWLLFLNNDVVLDPGSVAALEHFAACHPEAGVCGGRLRYPGGQRLQHAGIEQMLWGIVSNFGVGASIADPRFTSDTRRFAVTGAMLAVRRTVFEAIGGFDSAYVWGYEDVDLCLKARLHGSQVWYLAGAEGVHVESATLRTRRKVEDVDRNYVAYRRRWDPTLVPPESAFLEGMRASGIRRVAIFGTGTAGLALARTIERAGMAVETLAATVPDVEHVGGYPVVPLADLTACTYDRLLVGTQYFYEIEEALKAADPLNAPIFPVLPQSS